MKLHHIVFIGFFFLGLSSCDGEKPKDKTPLEIVELTTTIQPQVEITGFKGIEFGKTVAYYENKGVAFTKTPGGTFHFEKVNEKKSIGPVDFRAIYYLFEDEGRFSRIEAWTPRYNKEVFLDILVEKYGEDCDHISVGEIKGESWKWTFDDAIVTLVYYMSGKDMLFTIELNSPEYVLRKQKKKEKERRKARNEEIERAAREDF